MPYDTSTDPATGEMIMWPNGAPVQVSTRDDKSELDGASILIVTLTVLVGIVIVGAMFFVAAIIASLIVPIPI